MFYRFLSSLLAGLAVLAFSPLLPAQTAGQSKASKGKPDLSGVWGAAGCAYPRLGGPFSDAS